MIAHKTAKRYGLKPEKLKAQIEAESGWNPYAVSYVKGKPCAYGIAQFIPSTGRSWGLKTKSDLFNPVKSIDAMGRLMSSYVRTFKRQGDSDALAYRREAIAYNCGPGCVNKKGTISAKNTETPRYIANIARYEKQYRRAKR